MSLSTALDAVAAKDLGHVGHSIADGRIIEILPDEGTRWLIDPRPTEDPGRYKLWQVGSPVLERGPVQELRIGVITRLAQVLERWEGRALTPAWVQEARMAQVRLMALSVTG
ncbi:MAG TPA: hypothetical protein QGF58_11370 [Myxococcota bacterium]|nr:hypothetical protein [Myxococcota bacterium]